MKLKNAINLFYQQKLKMALQKNAIEEIKLYESILRQYSSNDIGTKDSSIFTPIAIRNIKNQIVISWKKYGFPENSLISLFLYGSWIRGTQSDSSDLNVYIIYVVFDSDGNLALKNSKFDIKKKVAETEIKNKFKTRDLFINLAGKKVKLDLYFKTAETLNSDTFHAGPKIYL